MFALLPYRGYGSSRQALDWFGGLFDEALPSLFEEEKALVPEFDVSETEEAIVVKADLPGIDAKDLDITITDNVLTLKGERKAEREEKKEHYHRYERRFGAFCRSFALPREVKAEGVEATYKDGVLQLTIPKSATAQTRKIEVTAAH